MKSLAIITYNHFHLKTEQILNNLLIDNIFKITLFALPFKTRKKKEYIFLHRPNQNQGIKVEDFRSKKINFFNFKNSSQLDGFDFIIITGAGILDKEIIGNKKIINVHPGIIPTTRGLDSFKWAIYNLDPLGITLHYIDQRVDSGEVLRVFNTPVYLSDTLQTLARRHYENEIYILSNFYKYLKKVNYKNFKEKNAYMRMSLEKEKTLEEKFKKYKEKFCK